MSFPELLRAFVLLFWSLIAPGLDKVKDARAIATGLVDAIVADRDSAPVYSSHLEDLAAGAFFAFRESSLQADAQGDCHELAPGVVRCEAHGPWQLHGACGFKSLEEQAACWLVILHDGKARCPRHPAAAAWGTCTGLVPYGGRSVPVQRLAAKREARIRELLTAALAAIP